MLFVKVAFAATLLVATSRVANACNKNVYECYEQANLCTETQILPSYEEAYNRCLKTNCIGFSQKYADGGTGGGKHYAVAFLHIQCASIALSCSLARALAHSLISACVCARARRLSSTPWLWGFSSFLVQ